MKVVYHLGVHGTDERRLVGVLRANAAALAARGIVVPDPETYRPVLRSVAGAMKGARASAETEETLLDAVMTEDEAARLVLSNESFLCMKGWAVSRGKLYPMAGEKVAGLVNLLPSHDCEVTLAIRNLATFLPVVLPAAKSDTAEVLRGGDLAGMSWLDVVGRIRAANPDLPITVWCDEDTPLIWPEVLRALTGAPPDMALAGENEILSAILTDEGMSRLAAYLAARPPLPVDARRRVVTAFVDKYARPEAMEVELDLPGWDEALIEELTERYDADLAAIARVPGVTVIAP